MQTVEQRHREAAAPHVFPAQAAAAVLAGNRDGHPIVQAFARFEASLPPSAPVDVSALATELQSHIEAFHDGVPQGQGETGDGGAAGKALCQWVYDNAEAICAALALPPSGIAEMVREMCAKSVEERLAQSIADRLWDDDRIGFACKKGDLVDVLKGAAHNALQGDGV